MITIEIAYRQDDKCYCKQIECKDTLIAIRTAIQVARALYKNELIAINLIYDKTTYFNN